MMICCIESLYTKNRKGVPRERGGRRRRIRTAIQAPKASVLPLHYVLYIGGLKTTHRLLDTTPKFIVCVTMPLY